MLSPTYLTGCYLSFVLVTAAPGARARHGRSVGAGRPRVRPSRTTACIRRRCRRLGHHDPCPTGRLGIPVASVASGAPERRHVG
ncbi:hypothetical protein PF005_g17671 [Phytophthora fragariae]|uniref:RxLR effector protein n=1 Tax=Phytophthora fragariae TaxID=53985 RepID=A0A6A3RDP0_9STRA|nr:hypothetical protein PF003_g15694 [Phytophthora fragariae]KAE8931059.1 hypothetical protein PF009_g18870 [Phytophthora fragariae]KAE8997192.1 hypothetical protein PF011_g15590 [Phytophthora fragariae]KAE9094502.1 hypothetical protein PF007_g17735 [Phytophthora fragariae]KAE9096091.1 hypothetical protein PF010_g16467 [Phytophthora fragariae]